jgi:hypothetical protein
MNTANFNEYMHPRNPFFNNKANFEELANLYDDFSNFCKIEKSGEAVKYIFDFKNPEAIRCLYCTLMKHYFRKCCVSF